MRGNRSFKFRYANVAATLALVVSLAGTGYAASQLAPGSVGTKQLKKGAVTTAKVKNFSLSYKDFQGGQLGLIYGYAHVLPDGTVDEANSFGVTKANVNHQFGYCFLDLDFPVHGVVLTLDGEHTAGEGTGVSLAWEAPPSDCSGNEFGEVIPKAANGQLIDAGFYIAFF
ncbi:MAG: hypothetical protein QOC87_2189 [Actinomycetota bacterium]|nr:hypothetical protein [Actinomycetota bacterium]